MSASCSNAKPAGVQHLVGSTPGDVSIKSMFSIPTEAMIDFIRWDLKMEEDGQFSLDINYGENQPNTLGFKNGGEKMSFKGAYSILTKEDKVAFDYVYIFKDIESTLEFSLVKITDNVFHVLSPSGLLMLGNGGWSYSLNRAEAIAGDKIFFTSHLKDEVTSEVVYDGRTPCKEIAEEHSEMKVSEACFKLKWKITFRRDPISHQPTTCTIRKVVDGKAQDLEFKWAIKKGMPSHPNAIIYCVDPDNKSQSIDFLVGDNNVLFFMDKSGLPYAGNGDFSFAMNRRME